jgi:hypothetical protein
MVTGLPIFRPLPVLMKLNTESAEGAILQSPCLSVCPSVHTFVTDISASTDFLKFVFILLDIGPAARNLIIMV